MGLEVGRKEARKMDGIFCEERRGGGGIADISEWYLCAGIAENKQEGKIIRKRSEKLVTTVGSR
jgi:hypothetical protein